MTCYERRSWWERLIGASGHKYERVGVVSFYRDLEKCKRCGKEIVTKWSA
jgi:hypothetical protein